ncbi:shikimate kinase [Spirochaetia bacterium]|nr:shikimate kinase [Spirochaetia bacterium]
MKNIFLTGPKHSGKTSVARALASLYSCDFIDLDNLIEERTGESPRTLYTKGADVFRKAEAEALTALLEPGTTARRVVATGGGIIDNPKALALLENNAALLVCLTISADTAWERIIGAPGGELPPFLKTENPRETHRVLHERRTAGYRQIAGIIIEAEGKKPEEIAKEIFDRVQH